MGHCWRSKNELISNVLLWTPTHGHTSDWFAKTYLHQLCVDTRYSLEDLLGVMDGEKMSGNWMLSVRLKWWLYIYVYAVHSISVQTFFVQAFKIVIDTWKFSMLLLYILWDDWHIFMISASNQQLQQQLEYILLVTADEFQKCNLREDTLEERYAIKFCFKRGKNTTEMYGMLQTGFGASCMNRASVFEWHMRFKEGRESVMDNERCGRSKKVNTPELIGQMVRVRVTMLRF